MLRFLTAGESHGPCLVAIIEGLPAGIRLTVDDINPHLARRQQGYGRGGRMRLEADRVEFLAGVRGGVTLGSPITLKIENRDWVNWETVMSPDPGQDQDEKAVTRPRPGHADLAGGLKYGHRDLRNVLERASARETAIRVAVGRTAAVLLRELGVEIGSHVVQIGPVRAEPGDLTAQELVRLAAASPVLCADARASGLMVQEIDAARNRGDSLGGIFEIIVTGLPPGLGSYAHWDRRLDGRLAQAIMSIPAIKGVEIGLGFAGAAVPGSQYHDPIGYNSEKGFYRVSNRAGGLEGGMTNGETLTLRAVMKPIPTLYTPLESVDLLTKERFAASVERSDVCAVPAAAAVGEAMTAWVLAVAVLEKFGGDTLDDVRSGFESYRNRIRQV